jgi:NAD(P)-dependent dehydrogenase (short-subunit alcohol dehydrogenase family)
MPAIQASALLRPDLLRGVSVLLAGGAGAAADGEALRETVRSAFVELGARVSPCELLAGGEAAPDSEIERALQSALEQGGGVEVLIVDGAGTFAAAGAGRTGLRVCMEAAWNVTRAVVNAAFIPGGEGGRIIYIAPAPGAGEHAVAARAGLENLSRTLSIEWARHRVTAVTIGLGDASAASEPAALAAYLASEAGAYFSGCLLDLSGPSAAL